MLLPDRHVPFGVILLNGRCLLRDHSRDHAKDRDDAARGCKRRLAPIQTMSFCLHQRPA